MYSNWVLGLFLVLICFFVLWYILPYVIRKIGEEYLRRRTRSLRAIVLTYDDGPSAELTPKILKLLDENDVKATFFMLGFRLNQSRNVALLVKEYCHEISSHSQSHLNAWKSLPWKAAKDLRMGFRTLGTLTDSDVFFRPPHGKLTLGTLIQVWLRRKRLGWWTIDSTDTHAVHMSAEKLIACVRREGGGVILMHDHNRDHPSNGNEFVLDITRQLLELARFEGFRVLTLGQLVDGS